jgi:undecaprenyl-diphosphatase
MKKKLIFILLSLLFLGFFIVFTLLARAKIFNQLDFDTTVRLQNHIPQKYDGILSVFSLLGSVEILGLLLLIIMIIRKKIISFLILIPFAAAHIVEIFGKALFHHPGPPFMFFRYNLGFLFPSSYVQPGSSYPSGHSLRIIFVSLIFFYLIQHSRLKNNAKVLLILFLLAFDVVMLISRVSLGEHWTTDVVGGALLGLSSGIFSLIFL